MFAQAQAMEATRFKVIEGWALGYRVQTQVTQWFRPLIELTLPSKSLMHFAKRLWELHHSQVPSFGTFALSTQNWCLVLGDLEKANSEKEGVDISSKSRT